MDEEQDFAYAVSAKALGHIAETAGRQASGVVAIRSRSAAVTDGVVHLHLAVRARYGSDLHGSLTGALISFSPSNFEIEPVK